MISNKDLLYNSCDKLSSLGHGSGREQRMQILHDRKRHNFSLYVPMWTHPVLLGQVWDVFEREKF